MDKNTEIVIVKQALQKDIRGDLELIKRLGSEKDYGKLYGPVRDLLDKLKVLDKTQALLDGKKVPEMPPEPPEDAPPENWPSSKKGPGSVSKEWTILFRTKDRRPVYKEIVVGILMKAKTGKPFKMSSIKDAIANRSDLATSTVRDYVGTAKLYLMQRDLIEKAGSGTFRAKDRDKVLKTLEGYGHYVRAGDYDLGKDLINMRRGGAPKR